MLNSPLCDPMMNLIEDEGESLLDVLGGAPKIMEEPGNLDENEIKTDDQNSLSTDLSSER